MSLEELEYTIALLKVPKIGIKSAYKLIDYCGSAKNIFQKNHTALSSINGINPYALKYLKDKKVLIEAEEEVKYIEKNNINYFYYKDDNYPFLLNQIYDKPILLFSKGNIDFSQKRCISIVGTRKMSPYGKQFLNSFFEELKAYDPLIISGLAYGVDILAHELALKHNLQTIACLAHGLNTIYPKEHDKYISYIKKNGGLLSEFNFNTSPIQANFIQRNRIIAGLSEATLVVESPLKSGALITAQFANSYNREVFAVPGRFTDQNSQGCNELIRTNRAHIITTCQELAFLLNWETKPVKNEKEIQQDPFIQLNDIEKNIYSYLKENGATHIDKLAIKTKTSISIIYGVLLQLELKGLINVLPGNLFEII